MVDVKIKFMEKLFLTKKLQFYNLENEEVNVDTMI